MTNIKSEVNYRKKQLAEAQRLRKIAIDQRDILDAAIARCFDRIKALEDWLFLNEPRTLKLRFDFTPEEIDDYEPMDSEPAHWYLQPLDEDGEDTEYVLQHDEEGMLAKACGFKKVSELFAFIGIRNNEEASDADGSFYEVTFKGDGTATIKEAKD